MTFIYGSKTKSKKKGLYLYHRIQKTPAKMSFSVTIVDIHVFKTFSQTCLALRTIKK